MVAKREAEITKVTLELTGAEALQLLALVECYHEEVRACRIGGWPAVKGIDVELMRILQQQVYLPQLDTEES